MQTFEERMRRSMAISEFNIDLLRAGLIIDLIGVIAAPFGPYGLTFGILMIGAAVMAFIGAVVLEIYARWLWWRG